MTGVAEEKGFHFGRDKIKYKRKLLKQSGIDADCKVGERCAIESKKTVQVPSNS